MARIPVPTLGMGTGMGQVDLSETLSKTKGIMDAVRANVDADAVAKILRAAAGGGESGGSSIPDGIGGLLQGVSGAFKGAIDVQTTLMQQMAKGGSGGGDSMMMLLIMQITQQSSAMMMQMLMESRKESDNRWAGMIEMIQNHHAEKIEDMRSRMGASPLDQMVHGDVIPALISGWTQNMNKSFADQVSDALAVIEKLDTVRGRAQTDEYSPGRLRWEEIQNDRLKITEDGKTKKDEVQARRDFWKHMPSGVGRAAKEVVNVLGNMGFGPLNYITPEADAAADEALQGMSA